MYRLEIGKPYMQGQTQWPETSEFYWLDSGPGLRRFVNDPTENEVEQFRTGAVDFGIVYAEGIVFVLAKFGSLDWIDAPFHISIVPEDRKPDLSKGFVPEEGAALQVYLVDAATGILKVIRAVTLSPAFTRQLHALMQDQAQRPMTRAQYEAAVDQAYRNHPMTELMLIKTLTKTRGGT